MEFLSTEVRRSSMRVSQETDLSICTEECKEGSKDGAEALGLGT